jgi:tetratricopeptide (TPR) repeat protein
MYELLVIVVAIAVLYRITRSFKGTAPVTAGDTRHRSEAQLARLVSYADRLYSERKWLAAEKAYLAVLKRDHKNVAAYNHLGIVYSLLHNYDDSTECFKIAASLSPGATTWQNLGLAYYERGEYAGAAAAFEKSIIAEPSAQRYLALGRAYRKLNDAPHMLTAFERAVELEPSPKALQALLDAYKKSGNREKALEIHRQLQALQPTASMG